MARETGEPNAHANASRTQAESGTSDGEYAFDRVFDASSDNKQVYDECTRKIVQNVMDGFNGTVFAYGQTSSGKTHTMFGSKDEPGVIPLAVRDVFDAVRRGSDREFLIRVSYLEIYNEKMMDLFAPEYRGGDDESASTLSIRENAERGTYVSGLREEIVTTPSQVLALLELGTKRRHVGATNMNAQSSRSHTIFRMIVESRAFIKDDSPVSGSATTSTSTAASAVLVSTLNLVDLAGSERVSKTGAEGQRALEGSHINKSLMTLGIVINKLAEGVESKGGHIPYRDSKLTRILQPALGGNSKTAIVCAMTPCRAHVDESHSTLRFASRAKCVVNNATVNEVVNASNAMIKKQQQEIAALKKQLEAGGDKVDDKAVEALRRQNAEAEREKQLMALALEDERAKAEEAVRAQKAKIDALTKALADYEQGNLDKTMDLRVAAIPTSMSAMTPETLRAVKTFETKIAALESDRDAIKAKFKVELAASEARFESAERARATESVDAANRVAQLKEEIAEITRVMVDGELDVPMLVHQLSHAKRNREAAESALDVARAELFEERSAKSVAQANFERVERELERLRGEMKQRTATLNASSNSQQGGSNEFVTREQSIKLNETIALQRERIERAERAAVDAELMLDEAIKGYEEEVTKRKALEQKLAQTKNVRLDDNGDDVSTQARLDLEKKCAALEDKYAVAKRAFAALEARAKDETARFAALDKENKDMKRQMHKLTEVYARLREKFTASGGAATAFDNAKDAAELRYELQALEKKRKAEKDAMLAKIETLTNEDAREGQTMSNTKSARTSSRAPLEDANARHQSSATTRDEYKIERA